MKIEKITQLSDVSNDSRDMKIALFTDKSDPDSLLFYSNLLDDSFSYYILEEQIIENLIKSKLKFNVILINKNLNLNNLRLLSKYSDKHKIKIIYAPVDDSGLNSQKNLIKKYHFILVDNPRLKESFNGLNSNILIIPSDLDEEYKFIKESLLFNEQNYASKYQLSDNDTFDSILHYLTLGVYENCNPFKDWDLDAFLKLYPEIKKYDINPFTYYVILNKLFRFNNYYSFNQVFEYPSLSRTILWDNHNTIVKDIEDYLQRKYVNDFHFEIVEDNEKLLFKQQNKFSNFKYDYLMDVFCKSDLMIKNRSTGKRFLKEINNFEAELYLEDLLEMDILGIYDIYVQLSTLNNDFKFRVKFDNQNNHRILMDKSNCRIFWSYETTDNHLAFKYQEANFIVNYIDAVNENDNVSINGEIILLDDLNFETVEVLMFLNQMDTDRQYITCDYEKNGNVITFTAKLDFKYYSTDISKNFKVDVRLKDEFGMILGSRVLQEYYIDDFKSNLKSFVKKSVFFESFHSQSYAGQPKYIYEKMLDMGLDKSYDFVWAYKGEYEIPGSPLITARGAKNYKDILGASDYWITNLSFPFLKPNKDIVYLQTTHGTPYKRMGSDIESDNENVVKGRVLLESDTWNYLLSPSDYAKDIFVRSFEYDGPVINKGYPANDIFYEDTSLKEQEIKEKLNIGPNKKIILYCPTFRDYEAAEDNQDKFSYIVDLENLQKNISDDYIFIMRLHYSVSQHLVLSEDMKDFIIDLSDYDDVADLYLISDILITDYSSVFFDFAHSKKPIIFFVPDYEKYSSFRGLYSEVRDILPGPEIFTDEELVQSIKNINDINEQFKEKYDAFYEKFCDLGHGTASEDVVNIIFGDENNE